MFFKYEFANENELNEIIKKHEDKFIYEIINFENDGVIIFSDAKLDVEKSTHEMVVENINKISILEAENETLKQELSITQDAVNELIFNSLNI